MNIHGYNPSSMSKAAFRCLTAGGGSIFRRDDGYFDHWAYDLRYPDYHNKIMVKDLVMEGFKES